VLGVAARTSHPFAPNVRPSRDPARRQVSDALESRVEPQGRGHPYNAPVFGGVRRAAQEGPRMIVGVVLNDKDWEPCSSTPTVVIAATVGP
jgi:hypothetical protein